MNLQPLFTTARVMTAVYRIASTALLLVYLAKRVGSGKESHPRGSRRSVDRY
jgi:hypothetical protein